MTSTLIDEILQIFYKPDGPERVGLIVFDKQLEVFELKNIAPYPDETFIVPPAALLEWQERLVGTWHTHPGKLNHPSVYDKQAFVNYPDLVHYIIGSNGIGAYAVDGDEVVAASPEKTDYIARLVEEVFSTPD